MSKAAYKKLKKCRVCRSPNLTNFLYLGLMPSVNNFLTSYQLNDPEPKYPLTVCFCHNCGMVQTREVVDPVVMYKNYVYISSFSKTMADHFEYLAKSLVSRFNLTSNSLVVEMGSNDGTLLKIFKKLGTEVLGVDPAQNLAAIANRDGIETWDTFFDRKTAKKILKEKHQASLVIGTNVFAHINNLDDILQGLNLLLSDDGIFVAEFPYLVDLIQGMQFDTIYHEHLSYFSLKPLIHLFARFDLELFDAERTSVHGGSIIIFVRKKNSGKEISKTLSQLLTLERKLKFDKIETFKQFAKKTEMTKKGLRRVLIWLKQQGKKVVGFGAPAKGNILLNFCGIDDSLLDYLTDNIPYKHGLYSPGTHLQVFPEEKIKENNPDYLLLLPWNFKEEILHKLEDYRKRGGKIIVPIPEVEII